MSGLELIQTLEKIKNSSLEPKVRLSFVRKLATFDRNILAPNIDPMLIVIDVLARRIASGKKEEEQILAAYILQLAKLSIFMKKHVKRLLSAIKKIFKKWPDVLTDYMFVAILLASKYMIETEPSIIFDDFIRSIVAKALSMKSKKIVERALDALFGGLWAIPWALNSYLEHIKKILDVPSDPLWPRLILNLGVLARKNFYAVRSIIDYLLSMNIQPSEMPLPVVEFFASIKVPIREKEYMKKVENVLSSIITSHNLLEARAKALVGFASLYKHPMFEKEKRQLLEFIRMLVEKYDDAMLLVSMLHALAIPVWGSVHVDDAILDAILQKYEKIQDHTDKMQFADSLLLVYSSVPELSRNIITFLSRLIKTETDIDLLSEILEVLGSIMKSEIDPKNVDFMLDRIISYLESPIDEFSVTMRITIIEQLLLPMAISHALVIVENADRIYNAYQKSKSFAVYDSMIKVVYEALKRYNAVDKNSVKLLAILFDVKELADAYPSMLEYLVGLAKKYGMVIARYIKVLWEIHKAILNNAIEIDNPRERYFLVDKALKDLVRILDIILPSAPEETIPWIIRLLLAIYVSDEGSAILDVIYALRRAKEIPRIYKILLDELSKIKIPDKKLELLRNYKIID